MKIIANGLIINGKNSYLRDGWNFMDFVIVVFWLVSLSAADKLFEKFKIIRTVRILRPLRIITKN